LAVSITLQKKLQLTSDGQFISWVNEIVEGANPDEGDIGVDQRDLHICLRRFSKFADGDCEIVAGNKYIKCTF